MALSDGSLMLVSPLSLFWPLYRHDLDTILLEHLNLMDLCILHDLIFLILLISLILFEFIIKKLHNVQIDEEILQQVIEMGFNRTALVESLGNRVQNEVSFATLSC